MLTDGTAVNKMDAVAVYESVKAHNYVGFVSAVLYLLSTLFGFFVAIPVGITLRNFDGMCVLYAQVVWDSSAIWPWVDASCDFVMYSSIGICIIYAFLMSFFTFIVVLPRTTLKADYVGLIQARHSTFILKSMNPVFLVINVLIAFIMFISAIVITVGFAQFCNDLTASKMFTDHNNGTSCYQAQDPEIWKGIHVVGGSENPRGHNFYTCLTIAMIGAWAEFIIWFVQMLLNFRYCCRGFTCGVAYEKQRVNKSQQVARSRMATASHTPGHMTPRGYGPPPPQMVAHAHMGGSNPQVSLGPLPHKS